MKDIIANIIIGLSIAAAIIGGVALVIAIIALAIKMPFGFFVGVILCSLIKSKKSKLKP